MTKREQVVHNFTYHPPRPGMGKPFELIRGHAQEYALSLLDICPESRELSVALTKLEEVVFWANAAIARNT